MWTLTLSLRHVGLGFHTKSSIYLRITMVRGGLLLSKQIVWHERMSNFPVRFDFFICSSYPRVSTLWCDHCETVLQRSHHLLLNNNKMLVCEEPMLDAMKTNSPRWAHNALCACKRKVLKLKHLDVPSVSSTTLFIQTSDKGNCRDTKLYLLYIIW